MDVAARCSSFSISQLPLATSAVLVDGMDVAARCSSSFISQSPLATSTVLVDGMDVTAGARLPKNG
jgi:hypothetical protein